MEENQIFSDKEASVEPLLHKDTEKKHCRILFDVMQAHGVRDIVLSPGSRNAPLLISASYRKDLKNHVITDERDAAFFALGLAMVSQRPVALACTSGTALYNYAPAIAEAYHQHIPLIVISADRPERWIDQNDSQTLKQPGALAGIVKKSFDIPVESANPEIEWYVNRMTNEALLLSKEGARGPVHINIRIDNPLSKTVEIEEEKPRIIRRLNVSKKLRPNDENCLSSIMRESRIMVVAGFMLPDDKLNKSLAEFVRLPNVILLAETISNLHQEGNPFAVDTVLAGLTDEEKLAVRPDVVIAIGGAPVSRMLKEYIREYQPKHLWTLEDTYFGVDCFKGLTESIPVSPAYFFKTFGRILSKSEKNSESCYSSAWKRLKEERLSIRKKYVSDSEWSELKAFDIILNTLPSDYNLFLSNGTSIRYGQLFTERVPHSSYCNRGVSGIDGTTATAAGCAAAYKGPTLLVTGDMSFAYSPGVMGIEDVPDNFKIIVINNKGGGIFRFISPTRYIEHRDRFFCADPKAPAEALAGAYGWHYDCVEDEEELRNILPDFFKGTGKRIIELKVDEEYSASLLRQYMRLPSGNFLNKQK